MDSKYIKIILLAVASVLVLSDFIVPFLSSSGTIIDLDGTMGYIDQPDLWGRIDPFSGVIYTMGDFICHQEMSRTMILNGNEMPVCVRCTGIIIGIAIGLALMLFLREYRRKRMILLSISCFILMFLDWMIQKLFTLNVPETRFITGLLAGVGAAIIVMMIIDGKIGLGNE